MDPITAIVTALIAGATLAAGDVGKEAVGDLYAGGKQAIVDAYTGLKALIVGRFGADSDVVDAVEGVEKRPDSDGRKSTLTEEAELAKLQNDKEIVAAAEKLMTLLKETPAGEKMAQNIQSAVGSYIAQAQGPGANASVNVNKPDK